MLFLNCISKLMQRGASGHSSIHRSLWGQVSKNRDFGLNQIMKICISKFGTFRNLSDFQTCFSTRIHCF